MNFGILQTLKKKQPKNKNFLKVGYLHVLTSRQAVMTAISPATATGDIRALSLW